MCRLVHGEHDGQPHTLAHDELMAPQRGLDVLLEVRLCVLEVRLCDVVVYVQLEHELELHELGPHDVRELGQYGALDLGDE